MVCLYTVRINQAHGMQEDEQKSKERTKEYESVSASLQEHALPIFVASDKTCDVFEQIEKCDCCTPYKTKGFTKADPTICS